MASQLKEDFMADQTSNFETRVKAAAIICVASRIFGETMKRPPSPNKLLRSQLAGDVMDKSMPSGRIAVLYPAKPDDQSDAEFLLSNLDEVGVVPPESWLPRRVPVKDWAEYTRAIRGLETFLQKAFTVAKLNKLESADVQGMLNFISPGLTQIPELTVRGALENGMAIFQ
jgi:hypothetical protein